MDEIEYKVGDEVWYAPDGCKFIVKCKITEVDDENRKKESQAYIWYDIDEPVGHFVDEEELVPVENNSSDDQSCDDDGPGYPEDYDITLAQWRQRQINFIVKAHQHRTEEENDAHKKELINLYPPKQYGKDWFYL